MTTERFDGYRIVAASFVIQGVVIGARHRAGGGRNNPRHYRRGQHCGPIDHRHAGGSLGGRRSLGICFVILLVSFVLLQSAESTWMLFLFVAVYGLAHGGFFTVMSPTLAEFFGTGSHGVIFGIVLFSGTIGGAVGPLLAGTLFDTSGSYELVFLILAGFCLLGLLLTAALGPMKSRATVAARESAR